MMPEFHELETFLSGMETVCKNLPGGGRCEGLKPSLVGWEPCDDLNNPFIFETFETFLGGMET